MSTLKLSFHAFLCTSLDGFIARRDGTVSFPNDALIGKKLPVDEDYGIKVFMSSLDAIVMGRATYEQALGFKRDGQGWQYGDTPLLVLSRTLDKLPDGSPDSATLLRINSEKSGIPTIIQRLAQAFASDHNSPKKVYVDGGQVVRQFIEAKALDELTITVIPILIGSGIKLFGSLEEDVRMDLMEEKHWDVGFVQLQYRLRYGPEY